MVHGRIRCAAAAPCRWRGRRESSRLTRWEDASTHVTASGLAPVVRRPGRATTARQHPGGRGADRGARRRARALSRLAGRYVLAGWLGLRRARRRRRRSRACGSGVARFGLANQVTLLRSGLVCLVGGALLASGQAPSMSWSLAGLIAVALGARCPRRLARPAAAAGLGLRRPLRRRDRRAAAADPGAAGLAGRAGRRLGPGDRPVALRLRAGGPGHALAAGAAAAQPAPQGDLRPAGRDPAALPAAAGHAGARAASRRSRWRA